MRHANINIKTGTVGSLKIQQVKQFLNFYVV